MSVFAIVASDQPSATPLEKAISDHFAPDSYLKAGDNLWLVDSDLLSTSAVADKLNLNKIPNPYGATAYLILPVTGYFGLQYPPTWEWLRSKGV